MLMCSIYIYYMPRTRAYTNTHIDLQKIRLEYTSSHELASQMTRVD